MNQMTFFQKKDLCSSNARFDWCKKLYIMNADPEVEKLEK
jgi:hypothetical protein